MAKTWEQIISEIGTVSEEQSRKDRTELLESMGMTWFEFLQTDEFDKMAKKIAEARFAPLVEAAKQKLEEEKNASENNEAAKKAEEIQDTQE